MPDGGFLIADSTNNRIRRVAADGTITTVAGNGTSSFSGDGGSATSAALKSPVDVVVTADGGYLVADSLNDRVRRVSAAGIITTIAGDGVPRSAGDGGPARGASLAGPVGLALLWSKQQVTVYVAEYGGGIRAITRGGSISTVRATVRLGTPTRLEYLRGGWLYVVDDKGAVTIVNTSRGHALQVAAVRGQRQEMVSPLAGRPIQ